MNEVYRTIIERRSIREFSENQISNEELNAIIKAGRYAPSAVGMQSCHFTIVQDKNVLYELNKAVREYFSKSEFDFVAKEAADEDFCFYYGAPTLVIASADKSSFAPCSDCACALQNMFLMAHTLNIGSVWLGALTLTSKNAVYQQALKKLTLPQNHEIYGSGGFGYIAGEIPVAADRREDNITIIK